MTTTSKTVCDKCGKEITSRENNVISTFHPSNGLRRRIAAELCPSCGKALWGDVLSLFEQHGIKG
jgi:uncharacterized protein with PIN domain